MATVAHPRTASNAQRGTIGLSAGDWIRLKRLQGVSSARSYGVVVDTNIDVDIPTVHQIGHSVPMLAPKHTGASRIRRTNGQWTDFKASQTADYITRMPNASGNLNAGLLVSTKLCNCIKTNTVIKITECKCAVYTHKSIK